MPTRVSALSRSLSMEILVHVIVLVFIYVPTITVFFPAALVLLCFMVLSSFSASSSLTGWISSDTLEPLIIAIIVTVSAGGLGLIVRRLKSRKIQPDLHDVRGAEGDKLIDLVQEIWATLSFRKAPSIRWFPAFDVAAYAVSRKRSVEIQISAGLWRTAVAGESIAKAILAHELAHIFHKDPNLLRFLEFVRIVTKSIITIVATLGGITILVLLIDETSKVLEQTGDLSPTIFRGALVIGGSAMVLCLLPLSWLAVRRHIAFIHSLIEIRADVSAGSWTGGLEEFTQAFATEKSVVRTGWKEFFSALASHKLTHIPERERLDILTSPQLLVTPKVRFFSMSVILALIMPLNFATGLLLGGAANHLIAQSMVTSFNVALLSMLIIGQNEGPVTILPSRIFTLAIVSVVFTSLPRINVEPVSYLIMSWMLGFGGAPADLSTLANETWTTIGDLWGKLSEGLVNSSALIAILLAVPSLWLFKFSSAQPAIVSKTPRVIFSCIVVASGSFIAGYDEFRAFSFPLLPDFHDSFDEYGLGFSMLLCLPIVMALLVDLILVGMKKFADQRIVHYNG